MGEFGYEKLIPKEGDSLEIEWAFETTQQQRINLCLLYKAVIYHIENKDTSRSPYVYAGIVYNTWINQNRCESDWVFSE